MEPNVLIRREQPGQLGTDDLEDIPEHGEEDKTAIEREDKPSSAGRPHGELETVQSRKLLVGELGIPSIAEEEQVEAVEDNVEGKFASCEELSFEPIFAHGERRLL
jgi:hypothetical protein